APENLGNADCQNCENDQQDVRECFAEQVKRESEDNTDERNEDRRGPIEEIDSDRDQSWRFDFLRLGFDWCVRLDRRWRRYGFGAIPREHIENETHHQQKGYRRDVEFA